jgi:hypothetical protein
MWRQARGLARSLAALTVLSVSVALPVPAVAQSGALTDLNLPYLHYFGFGVFKVGDQQIWTLRGRLTPSIRSHEGGKIGIAPRLSGSISGIRQDSFQEELRTSSVLTAAVGLELRFPLSERSLIRTYGDVGAGFDLEHDNEAGFGLLGILGEFVFPWKGLELGLQPSVDLAGSVSSLDNLSDRLLAVQLKGDARHYLDFRIWGNRAQVGVYGYVGGFFGDTDLDAEPGGTQSVNRQYELGVTFGTHPRPKIILFRPLINLGFRWGPDLRGIRFGLGDRMTRLPPIP